MNTHAKAVQSSYIYARENPQKAQDYVAANLKGYHIHEGLSDNHSVVLHNDKTNDIIIAYRGTMNSLSHPIQTLQDYGADVEIALGLPHIAAIPREQEANVKYHRTAHAFPDANISVAGHSLGGVESYYVATKNNLQGHHFNIGESPLPGISTLNKTMSHFHVGEQYDKQHIYHAENYKALGNVYNGSDPISEGTRYLAGQHRVVKVNTRTDLKAHDLSNFISDTMPKSPKAAITRREALPPPDTFDIRMKPKHKKKSHATINGRRRYEETN